MKIMAAIALALGALTTPAAAPASDRDANALYTRFSVAHAALNTAALEPLYAPGATYLPRRESAILSREEIMRRERTSHDGMRANGGSIELKFRITDRKRFGDVYVDNGYMRRTLIRNKGEPAVTTTSKLILVMAKQPDGRWALVSDADSDAPAEAYDGAKPVPGLKFDR